MSAIGVLTYNVRGLNIPTKRYTILEELRRNNAHILFLQETHITQDTNVRIYSKYFPIWYYGDSPTKRAKGVAIAIAKDIGFSLEERMVDPEGRYIFLKGQLQGIECTLANIYCPNKNAMKYLKNILDKLILFKKGNLILGGDFNFCMNPSLDCTSSARGLEGYQLRMVRKKLFKCQLIDAWRIQHPGERDYSFHSPVHSMYSRIDYIMIEHRLIESVVNTSIEIMSISDHAPVILEIKLLKSQKRINMWRLNGELI